MKIYELYFNPENERKKLKSFQHQAKNLQRSKLGRLYMVGEISAPRNEDSGLPEKIFDTAKEAYYRDASLSPEESLKRALKEVNGIIREYNVKNRLNLALFSSKNFDIHFSVMGDMKLLLLNEKKSKDLSKELEVSPDSFESMISGKIARNEKLAILTPEINEFFQKEGIIRELKKHPPTDELMERMSSTQKEKFPSITGISLIMDFTITLKDNDKKFVTSTSEDNTTLFKKFIRENFSGAKKKIKNIKASKIKNKEFLYKFKGLKNLDLRNKKVYLPLALIVIIVAGSLMIGIERKIRESHDKQALQEIREEMEEGRENEDFLLMKESFSRLEEMVGNTPLEEEAQELYKESREHLLHVSGAKEVEDLNKLTSVEEIIEPENIALTRELLVLSSSRDSLVGIIEKNDYKETPYSLPTEEGVKFTSSSQGKVLLFSPENTIFHFENGNFSQTSIKLPEDHKEFISLSSFMGIPYFLNSRGDIIHYPEEEPLPWIKEGEDRATKATSLAIDGAIFAFTQKGDIYHYYRGEKEDLLDPFVFPSLEGEKNIHTTSETPLIIPDPKEGRIVLVEKETEEVKQLFNEKFKDLKDLSISRNDKKIYLLIGKEVYSLEI